MLNSKGNLRIFNYLNLFIKSGAPGSTRTTTWVRRSRIAFSSADPFLKGVTSAPNEPRNLVLAVMIRSAGASLGMRSIGKNEARGVIDTGSRTAPKGF